MPTSTLGSRPPLTMPRASRKRKIEFIHEPLYGIEIGDSLEALISSEVEGMYEHWMIS
jgi:hypothetical protein